MPLYEYIIYGRPWTPDKLAAPTGTYAGLPIETTTPKQAIIIALAREFGASAIRQGGAIAQLTDEGWIGKEDLEEQLADLKDDEMDFLLVNGDIAFDVHLRRPNDIVFPGTPQTPQQRALRAVLAVIESTYEHDEVGNRLPDRNSVPSADTVAWLCGLEDQIRAALTP